MSWQDYVDKQLLASGCVQQAVIAGQDGSVWAKSDGFEVRFVFLLIRFVHLGFHLEALHQLSARGAAQSA